MFHTVKKTWQLLRQKLNLVRVEWLLMTILLSVIGGLLADLNILAPINYRFYDFFLAQKNLPVPDDILIIYIEPDTLNNEDLTRRQWSLADSSVLIRILSSSNSKAILFNYDLTATSVIAKDDEQELANEIRKNHKIILPISLNVHQGVVSGFRLPIAVFANPAGDLGHNFIRPSGDGIVRYLPLFISNGDISWQHVISSLLAISGFDLPKTANELTINKNNNLWQEMDKLHLRFLRNGEYFTTISARQVLNGEFPADYFSDKIVLIGAQQNENLLYTPGFFSPPNTATNLELFANGINTLRHYPRISIISSNWLTVFTVLTIVLLFLAFLIVPTHHHFWISIITIFSVLLISWMFFTFANLWIAPAGSLFILLTAYPLWAWRRLTITHRFLLAEQEKIAGDLQIFGNNSIGQKKFSNNFAPKLDSSIDKQLQLFQLASDRLRSTKKFISDIIDVLPSGIFVSDINDKIIFANSEAIQALGIADKNSIFEKSLSEVINYFNSNEKSPIKLLENLDTQQSNFLEIFNKTQPQLIFWAICRKLYSAQEGGRNNYIGKLLILTEISQIRFAEKQRKELLRFVSHDLRSPLASIIAVINMRSDKPDKPNERSDDERFQSIERYTQQSLNLAQEFLQLIYAENYDSSQFITTDLILAIDSAITIGKPIADERKINIQINLPEVAFVNGSYSMIERAFINLIHNAVKYGKKGSLINITLVLENQLWKFKIVNENQQLELIAGEKFQEKSHEPLGLMFVRIVISKHQGEFNITDNNFITTAELSIPALTQITH